MDERLSEKDRQAMVAAVQCGQSQRAVARRFGVGLSHLQYWLARARGQKLERVDWADQSHAPPQQGRQTSAPWQRRVLALRRELRPGDLGFVGAQAIAEALPAGKAKGQPPSLRTIGRILKRHGALDAVRRVRRTAPPAGWYLPDVAAGTAELDAFDVIEDLPLEGGPRLDVLTTRALWGSVCGAWGSAALRSRWLCERMEAHWRQHGCPLYAQFDNDTRFQGTHTHPDVLGQAIRLCLALGITPVFAPPREHGPQNLNESFNHLLPQKVWKRFHHASRAQLRHRSDRFVAAHHVKSQARQETAPARLPWSPDRRPARADSKVIFIRRTDDTGRVRLLGSRFLGNAAWNHRLVRREVHPRSQTIHCFGLRRSQPNHQPLLVTYHANSHIAHFVEYRRLIAAANSSYAQ